MNISYGINYHEFPTEFPTYYIDILLQSVIVDNAFAHYTINEHSINVNIKSLF